MYSASIDFEIHGKITEAGVDAVLWLLSIWFKNGQLSHDVFPLVQIDQMLRAYVQIPAKDSLSKKYSNKFLSLALKRLGTEDIGTPSIRVLGFDPASVRPCKCKQRTSHILFTTYLSQESPLRCGDCFGPIPLYLIPHTSGDEHWDVMQWAFNYAACDTLQMGCTVGEKFGERELLDVESNLSAQGRAVCASIAITTGLPTYYFLSKCRARSLVSEKRRMYPVCGDAWVLEKPWHNKFDFKCDACLLLSNFAYSVRYRS